MEFVRGGEDEGFAPLLDKYRAQRRHWQCECGEEGVHFHCTAGLGHFYPMHVATEERAAVRFKALVNTDAAPSSSTSVSDGDSGSAASGRAARRRK